VPQEEGGQLKEIMPPTGKMWLPITEWLIKQCVLVAYRSLDTMPETVEAETIERELVFGLIAMIDPQRKKQP
jgi:hypothetical protein